MRESFAAFVKLAAWTSRICEDIAVRVVSRRRLPEFWERHPRAATSLSAWYKIADEAEWEHLDDARSVYPTADAVGEFTVFNISWNDFRLVTRMACVVVKGG